MRTDDRHGRRGAAERLQSMLRLAREGLTANEIGERLGLKAKSVHKALSKASGHEGMSSLTPFRRVWREPTAYLRHEQPHPRITLPRVTLDRDLEKYPPIGTEP